MGALSLSYENRSPLFTNICPVRRIVPWHMSGMRPPIATRTDSGHTHKQSRVQLPKIDAHRGMPVFSDCWHHVCVCARHMPPMNHHNLLIAATEPEVIRQSAGLEIKMTIWIVLGKAGNSGQWIGSRCVCVWE